MPDSTGMVKLDAMENPYRCRPSLRGRSRARAASARSTAIRIRRRGLKRRLRVVGQCLRRMDVLLGNGSDELIQMLVRGGAARRGARRGAVVRDVPPDRTFAGMQATWACRSAPISARPAGGARRRSSGAAGAHVHRLSEQSHRQPVRRAWRSSIIEAAPGIVVVDEAYHAFAGASFHAAPGPIPNLLVMRTLFKLGLAGFSLGALLRLGRGCEELDKVRLPYNVSTLTSWRPAQCCGTARCSTEQAAHHRASAGACSRVGAFARRDGVFRATRISSCSSQQSRCAFSTALKQRGVLIKNLHGSHRLLENCLRVTVGTPEENDRSCAAQAERPRVRSSCRVTIRTRCGPLR